MTPCKESIENQALQLELNEALGDEKPKDEMVNELKSKVSYCCSHFIA